VSRPPVFLDAADTEDAEALSDLERLCHPHPWTMRSFLEELSAPERSRVVVLRRPFEPGDRGRGIAGYCAYQVFGGEMHVLNLAVAPEHRQQGLGSFLLAWALESGARRGAGPVFLEVRPSNREARRLYGRFGFRQVGVRPGYYTDPLEDALVLSRTAAGALVTAS
jgi:[ribosomal protein S18]-alanine N-acetyltransferase